MSIVATVSGGFAAVGRGFNRFLEFKNDDEMTKKLTVFGVLLLTLGLAVLSISGAFAKSSGSGWDWIPRVAYACVVFGLETLAAVLFTRAMRAQQKVRMWVCLAVLPFLTWANVQNAKDGLRHIMPDVFGQSSAVLSARADLAAEEAVTLGQAQQVAISGTGSELERVRKQIADLKVEQRKMAAQSPEGIKEAQALLIAQGKYFGRVDGIRENLTEAAMRGRGEEIQAELASLSAREEGLLAGQASPVQAATTAKRLEEIENRAAAQAAHDEELRAEVIFWVAEFARNLLLWAAITSVTAGAVATIARREDELAEAEHQAKLAALRGQMAPAAPPVAAEPPPPPPPEPEPEPAPEPVQEPLTLVDPPEPEMTPQQRAARQGGLAAQHERRAAKTERLLVIGPVSTLDQMKVAAE